MFKRKIGLALGGGGARGAAHVGVLEHFEKIGLQIDCLSGTSAGAIIAGLYAFGIKIEVIKNEISKINPAPLSSMKFGKLGLFENTEVKEMLTRLLPSKAQIENSKIPLIIKTTDLISGDGVYLNSGSVIDALLASSCVPGFYLPYEYQGKLLVDGGLTENVPLKGLKQLGATFCIGVNLNGQTHYSKPEGIFEVISLAMDIAIDAQTRRQIKEADVMISLDLTQYSRTNKKDFDQLVIEGRKVSKEKAPNLIYLFWWLRFKKLWNFIKEFIPIKIPTFLKKDEEEK